MSDTRHDPGTAGLPDRSLFSRIALTPLIDVLRGRLSCRLDMQAVFDRAQLPVAIADRIRLVAKRTRLWRVERVEVAAELAAHFADGLEAGRSAEELLESFGDPRRAAALIRRAKKRGRHWLWRGLVRTVQGLGLLVGLCVILYAFLTLRYLTASPTVRHNYTAELNAPLSAIPDEQKAWPLYRRAILAEPKFPAELAGTSQTWPDTRPGDPDWDLSLGYIEGCREYLDLARRASRLPLMGKPLSATRDLELERHLAEIAPTPGGPPEAAYWLLQSAVRGEDNPSMFAILLPELGQLRNLARHLAFDTRVAAHTGDADRAFADSNALFASSEHACQSGLLISDLVGLAIFSLGTQKLGELLAEYPSLLSDKQLVDLAHTVGAWRGGGRIQVSLAAERVGFDDVLQRIYTDDGNSNGRLTPEGVRLLESMTYPPSSGMPSFAVAASPLGAAVMASRAEMRGIYNRLLDAVEAEARVPLWQRSEDSRAEREFFDLVQSPVGRARYFPVSLLVPALSKAMLGAERTTQTRDGMLVAIALELYRRHAGHYPTALDAMVPSFLPSVPPDRFDGKPLRYRRVHGRPVVYSIGSDGEDDGGRPPKSSGTFAGRWYSPAERSAKSALVRDPQPIPDGDWVLWPPIRYDPKTGELVGTPDSSVK